MQNIEELALRPEELRVIRYIFNPGKLLGCGQVVVYFINSF